MNEQFKKKPSKLKIILIVIAVLFVIGFISNLFDDGNESESVSNTPTEQSSDSTESSPSDSDVITPTSIPTSIPTPTEVIIKTEPFEVELSAGHYTSGIDFPSGTYSLKAVSGSGNASSSNMFSGGLNEVMGVENDGFSTSEFNNAKLEDGVVLSVSGDLILQISSEAAYVADLQPRTNDLTETISLSSGHYVAGVDFPTGIYDVVAADGSGNVSSSNMFDGGLNEIIGTDNDGFSISLFKNCDFSDGVELSISSVSINLVPSTGE